MTTRVLMQGDLSGAKKLLSLGRSIIARFERQGLTRARKFVKAGGGEVLLMAARAPEGNKVLLRERGFKYFLVETHTGQTWGARTLKGPWLETGRAKYDYDFAPGYSFTELAGHEVDPGVLNFNFAHRDSVSMLNGRGFAITYQSDKRPAGAFVSKVFIFELYRFGFAVGGDKRATSVVVESVETSELGLLPFVFAVYLGEFRIDTGLGTTVTRSAFGIYSGTRQFKFAIAPSVVVNGQEVPGFEYVSVTNTQPTTTRIGRWANALNVTFFHYLGNGVIVNNVLRSADFGRTWHTIAPSALYTFVDRPPNTQVFGRLQTDPYFVRMEGDDVLCITLRQNDAGDVVTLGPGEQGNLCWRSHDLGLTYNEVSKIPAPALFFFDENDWFYDAVYCGSGVVIFTHRYIRDSRDPHPDTGTYFHRTLDYGVTWETLPHPVVDHASSNAKVGGLSCVRKAKEDDPLTAHLTFVRIDTTPGDNFNRAQLMISEDSGTTWEPGPYLQGTNFRTGTARFFNPGVQFAGGFYTPQRRPFARPDIYANAN